MPDPDSPPVNPSVPSPSPRSAVPAGAPDAPQPVVTDFLPENFRSSDPSGWSSALTGHVGTMLDSPLRAAWEATSPEAKTANLEIAKDRVATLRALADGYDKMIEAHEVK